jgi:hypothetical protein
VGAKGSVKRKLSIAEGKTLRRILRPTNDTDGTGSIKTSDELNSLIRNANIYN